MQIHTHSSSPIWKDDLSARACPDPVQVNSSRVGLIHDPREGYDALEVHQLSLQMAKQSNSIQTLEKDLLAVKSQNYRICDLQQKIEQLQMHTSVPEYTRTLLGDPNQSIKDISDLKAQITKIEECIENQQTAILNLEVQRQSPDRVSAALDEIDSATKQCSFRIDALSASSASLAHIDNLQVGAELHTDQIQGLQNQITGLRSTMDDFMDSKQKTLDLESGFKTLRETVESLGDSTSLVEELVRTSDNHSQSIHEVSTQLQNLWEQKTNVSDIPSLSGVEDLRAYIKEIEDSFKRKIENLEIDITQSVQKAMSEKLEELSFKIISLSDREVPNLVDYEELALRVDTLCSNRVKPSDFNELKEHVDSLSHLAIDSAEIAALKASVSEISMQSSDAILLEKMTEEIASCEDRLMSKLIEDKEQNSQMISEVVDQRVADLAKKTEKIFSTCSKEQDVLRIAQKLKDIEGELHQNRGCTEKDVQSIIMEYGHQNALAANEKADTLFIEVDELRALQEKIQQETKAHMEELKQMDGDQTQRLKRLETSVGVSGSEYQPKITESLFSRISTVADKVEESCTNIEAMRQDTILTADALERIKNYGSRLEPLEEQLQAIKADLSSKALDTVGQSLQSSRSATENPLDSDRDSEENTEEKCKQEAAQQEIMALVAAIHGVQQCTQSYRDGPKEVSKPFPSSSTDNLPFEGMVPSNELPNTRSGIQQFLEWLLLVNKERDELMATTCNKVQEIETAIGEQAKSLEIIKNQRELDSSSFVSNSLEDLQCRLATQDLEIQGLKDLSKRWKSGEKDSSLVLRTLESIGTTVDQALGQDPHIAVGPTQLYSEDDACNLQDARSGSSEV